MSIKCCHGCVAPKRYSGCGDRCPEYKEEKAQAQAEKQAAAVRQGITSQKYDGVYRAFRRKGRK